MAGTALLACKAYLVDTAMPTMFGTSVQVSYGLPPSYIGQDLVYVGDAQVQEEMPVYGTPRPQEETIELSVVIKSSRRGNEGTAQRVASEAAMGLLTTLRDYFKVLGNETLGGACRQARVTSYQLSEDPPDQDTTQGRLAEIHVTITIRARN